MPEQLHDDRNNPYRAPDSDVGGSQSSDPKELQLATRWARFFAALIDGILMLLLIWTGLYVFAGITPADIQRQATTQIQIAMTLGGYVAFFLVHGYLLAKRSQTFGKFVFKIKIVGIDDRDASFWRIILKRYLPTWLAAHIPFVGGVLTLIDVLFIFRKDRRCLHDLIAETKVVRVAAAT